jgi:hypothetical protein
MDVPTLSTVEHLCALAAELGAVDTLGSCPADRELVVAVCRRSRANIVQIPTYIIEVSQIAEAYDRARLANGFGTTTDVELDPPPAPLYG